MPPNFIVPASGTYDKFLQFRAVVLCSVAEIWSNPEFKEKFLADPATAMRERFGYVYPFRNSYTLSAQSGASTYTPLTTLGWTIRTEEKLTLVLPPKPKAKSNDPLEQALLEARALANYNLNHLALVQYSEVEPIPPGFPDLLPPLPPKR